MTSPLTVGIIGYGKMGQAIELAAKEKGIRVGAIIDINENKGGAAVRSLNREEIDVLLEFTQADMVVDNVRSAAETGINMVVGTTGWYDKIEEVKSIISDNDTGFFYASNFSIGMNIMFQLVRRGVLLLNGFPEYDIYVHEAHHTQKKDSPSGSAYTLANIIVNESARKKRMEIDRSADIIDPASLHVTSTRAGQIIGTHTVGFDSDFDSIEIKHTAKNRTGFVQGALRAAQWLKDRKGFYTMEDLLRV